jgi:hypothetical protein
VAGIASKNFAKIGYVVFQLLWVTLTLIIMFHADKFNWLITEEMMQCPQDMHLIADTCFGTSILMRMSFAHLLTHSLVFLIILGRSTPCAVIHDGCWAFKGIVFLGIFVSTFWMDNGFFIRGYLSFSKYVSTVFLIYQAMLMLMVAYKVNEVLVGNYEKDQTNCSGFILLAVTTISIVGNLVWIVKQYKAFGCAYNTTIMTVTVVGCVLMYGLVLLRSRQDASILTSSIAATYCLYL